MRGRLAKGATCSRAHLWRIWRRGRYARTRAVHKQQYLASSGVMMATIYGCRVVTSLA